MSGNDLGSFGEHLRSLREHAGITQEELAERSGLSRDAISALERGRRQFPHPNTIRMLADGLGLVESDRESLRNSVRKRPASTESGRANGALHPVDLPNPVSMLIGRETERAHIHDLLDRGARLITLTGPGGVGKSRLAIQIAHERQDHLPVVFVSLASLPDRSLILPAIVQALRLRNAGAGTALEHLQLAIGVQSALIVLDNMEHLDDAHLDVRQLLDACPNVAVLATSRSTLHLSQETAVPVHPLPVRAGDSAGDAPSDAVLLFVERARAARPDFRLTPENATAVATLCKRLDGLPLAIELAAARIKVLSPASMLARLESRLDLLAGGPRDQAPRLQSLRSALGWSYDLLDPGEQDLFCVLSTFAASFALDDAETVMVTTFPAVTSDRVLNLIASLVDKNLVASEPDDQTEARFSMLQTVRDYGRERLDERGLAFRASSAHAACFLAVAERAFLAFRQRNEHEWWLNSLERDRNNIRQALVWFAEHGEGESLARLAGALYWFWDIRGPLAEGRVWLEQALALSPDIVPEDVCFQVLLAAGQLAHFQGDDERAQVWSTELYARIPASADPWMRGTPLMLLGLIAEDRGDYSIAEDRFSAALALFEEAGDAYNAALAVHHLGVTAWGLGDTTRATSLCSAALQQQQQLNDTWHLSNSYGYLGLIAISTNRPIDAAINLRECMDIRRRSDAREDIASSITDFAALAAATDRPDQAARLFGAASALRKRIGRLVINLPEREIFERAEEQTRLALTPEARAEHERVGASWTLDQAVSEAHLLADEIIAHPR